MKANLATRAARTSAMFRAFLAVILCVGLMIPTTLTSGQAYAAPDENPYSHGDIAISSDKAEGDVIELAVGDTATITVTPFRHVQYKGCLMPICPQKCEEMAGPGEVCFVKGSGCKCSSEPVLRHATIAFESANGEIAKVEGVSESANLTTGSAVGSTNDGIITLTGLKAGETTVTVKATGLDFWTNAEHTYTVKVTDGSEAAEAPEIVDGAYQLDSEADLVWFANYVNGEVDGATHPDASATLTADIALESGVLPMIAEAGAKLTKAGAEAAYAGAFDGAGHTISGITELTSTKDAAALFGAINGATIKNLTLEGSATVEKAASPFVCYAYAGTIENCVNRVSVSGANNVGGIVASMAKDGSKYAEDGKVIVKGCMNEADLATTGNAKCVGGIVAGAAALNMNPLEVSQCGNKGAISSSKADAGGIVGSISNKSANVAIGGCYNEGTIASNATSMYGAGGIVGRALSGTVAVSDSYNGGAVNCGEDGYAAGGLVGFVGGSVSANIENFFSIGVVTAAEGGTAGALFGNIASSATMDVKNSYYLDSAAANAAGEGAAPAGIAPKTADEMKGAEFAALLGSAFVMGPDGPVLNWQQPSLPAGAAIAEGQQVQLRQASETGTASVSLENMTDEWAATVTGVSVKALNGNDAGTVTELSGEQYKIGGTDRWGRPFSGIEFTRTDEAPVFSVALGEGEPLDITNWRGQTNTYPQSKDYEITIKANGYADTVGTVKFYTGGNDEFKIIVDTDGNNKTTDDRVTVKTYTREDIAKEAKFQNGSSQCGMTGFRTFSGNGVTVQKLVEGAMTELAKEGIDQQALENAAFEIDVTDHYGVNKHNYDSLFGKNRYFFKSIYTDREVIDTYHNLVNSDDQAGATVQLRRILAEKAMEDNSIAEPMIATEYAEVMLDGEDVGKAELPTEKNTHMSELVAAENSFRFIYGIRAVQEDKTVTFETGEGATQIDPQTVKSHFMSSGENTTMSSSYWANSLIIYKGAGYETEQPKGADKITKPADPVRDGYTFEGWYTKDGSENGDWGTQFDFEANDGTVDVDTKLYAKWSGGTEAVGNSSYSVDAYREAQYGLPPTGDSSNAGQHVKVTLGFDGPVAITDAEALLESVSFAINGGAAEGVTAKAEGNTLVLDATLSFALMAGKVDVSATAEDGTLAGVTVDGKPAKVSPITTYANTGLAFKIVEVVEGTADTPASTTFQVTSGANVRSMNHVVWLSNQGAGDTLSNIFENSSTATTAHHHGWHSFTRDDSANSIVSNAVEQLAAKGYTVTQGENGQFTIAANTSKAGEILSASTYDDAFLQANGLKFGDPVRGIAAPEAAPSTSIDLGMAFPAEPQQYNTSMGKYPAGRVDFTLTPSEAALAEYQKIHAGATMEDMVNAWAQNVTKVTLGEGNEAVELSAKSFSDWKGELTKPISETQGKLGYYMLSYSAGGWGAGAGVTLTIPAAMFDVSDGEIDSKTITIESLEFGTVTGTISYRSLGSEGLVVRTLDKDGTTVLSTKVLTDAQLKELATQQNYKTSANCGMAGLRTFNSEGVLLADALEAAGVDFGPGMTLKVRVNDGLPANGTADTEEDNYWDMATFTYEKLMGEPRYHYPMAWDETPRDELGGKSIHDVLVADKSAWKQLTAGPNDDPEAIAKHNEQAKVLAELIGRDKVEVAPLLAWKWNEGVIAFGGSNEDVYHGYTEQQRYRFVFGMLAEEDGSVADDNTTFANTYGVFGIDIVEGEGGDQPTPDPDPDPTPDPDPEPSPDPDPEPSPDPDPEPSPSPEPEPGPGPDEPVKPIDPTEPTDPTDPTDPTNPDTPNLPGGTSSDGTLATTGDRVPMAPIVCLAGAAALLLALAALAHRKNNVRGVQGRK